MKIIIDNPMYTNIDLICSYLGEGSKFLGSWCIKNKNGNWSEQPVDVYYNPKPPEPFTNKLVGYFIRDDWVDYPLFVCDATSVFEIQFMPCLVEDDIVYISKYRHDLVVTDNGSIIDGGRDYIRTNLAIGNTFISFDAELGNFYLSKESVHGYELITIEYKDINVTNK